MRKKMLVGIFALCILAAGCSKDELNSDTTNVAGNGAVIVAIKGEGVSKALYDTYAIGNPDQATENTVKSFSVYVFNYNSGMLEKKETFTSGFEGQVKGLSIASSKRVVVLVNEPKVFPTIYNYADFQDAQAMISLDSQVPGDFSETGLFMSGEQDGAVKLEKEQVTKVTVLVKRITAKVRMGTLSVIPDAGLSLDNFVLSGISIQKARNKAPVFGGLATEGFNYFSGLPGSSETSTTEPPKDYLHEAYNLPTDYVSGIKLNPQVYFYVFPNDNTDNRATMLSLWGTYAGEDVYYSFYINDKTSGTGENATDGTWIQRNKIYTLNVSLKKLGNGSEDPDVPNEQVALDVVVDVSNWDGELVQEVEW